MGVYFITTPAFLREIGAVTDVDHVILTLQTPNGETKSVTLLSQAGGDLIRSLVPPDLSHPAPLYYSACQIFIAQVEMLTHAIFVGEPSASSPNFIGEDVPVTLPFSQLTLSISTRYHEGNAGDPWIWIPPSIPVSLSSKDYFANRDPALQAIIDAMNDK